MAALFERQDPVRQDDISLSLALSLSLSLSLSPSLSLSLSSLSLSDRKSTRLIYSHTPQHTLTLKDTPLSDKIPSLSRALSLSLSLSLSPPLSLSPSPLFLS